MTNHAYELHPLCTLFPRLAEAELEALAGDIATNGLREPITLHDGLILDGGNRYRACLLAGVEPTFKEFDGGNLVSFVLSANLHRRHLSAGQQAAIVASAQDWAKAQTVGNPALKVQKCNLAPLDTAASRAAESGASLRTQKMADKVAKADPELAREVAHGTKSLPQAVEQLTGKRPGGKPGKQAPTEDSRADQQKESDAAPAVDPRDDHIKGLTDELEELRQTAQELLADNVSMSSVFDADDKLTTALAENKRLRAEVSGLRERVNGLMAEKNEAIRLMKSWRKKAEKAEAALKAGV